MTTKDKIIFAAVQLFVEQGVAQTTTREIAQRADVAEGSIYRYFPSKEELAWQIFHAYHQSLAQSLSVAIHQENKLEQQIQSLVDCFLSLADDDWLMFRYYLTAQHTHMHKISADMMTPYTVVYSVIDAAKHNEELHCTDSKIIAAMAMGAVHQIAVNKIYGRIEGDLKPHVEEVSRAVYGLITASAMQSA